MEIQWKELIERAKKNDQDAFSALYENSYDAVYRTVKSMVKDEDTAMDIVQNAFVSGFANLDGFQPPENFIPWMRRIATNKTRDWFRKKHDIAFSQLGDEEDNLPEFEDEKPDHSPEVVLDRSETTRLIEEILGTLSEEQRIAVGMYYYEEMSVAEIAATLGVSENTVKSRLNYGRKKIKAGVEELEKKGTKLYSLSPIPFLIWLLRCQMAQPAKDKAPLWLLEKILARGAAQATAGAAGSAAAAGTAAAATKTGLLSTLGAKITAAVLAVALVGGTAAIVSYVNRGEPTPEAETPQTIVSETESETYGEELTFKLNDAGTGYVVIGIGSCTDAELIIPSMYKGLPVTDIGTGAFYNCDSLTSVTIPDGVSSIGLRAFIGCDNLESVTIPASVTDIGESAFKRCTSLTSITIPDGVTTIGESAFYECTALMSVTLPDGVTTIGGFAFNSCTALTNFTIPGSVTDMGMAVFSGCTALTSVTIAKGVTAIGKSAFHGCTALTNVTIPDSMKTIGEAAFTYCESLESVTIPAGVKTIDVAAFSDCTSLKSVTIPDGVTEIGSGAFMSCTSLTSVTIPKSITEIGENAFAFCKSLPSIHYDGTVAEWGQIAQNSAIAWYDGVVVCTDGTTR